MSVFEFPMVFPAGGASLVGRLYRNVDDLSTPQPAVVVTGSWLTVKEQMPRTYAPRLAEQGITAFTFDFTGFGQSGGTPRQLELPARKIADIAAAADFLSTMAFVKGGGVGHVGICASAQYALAAIARGARIRSFASIAGWYHDAESVAPFYGGVSGTKLRLDRARAADLSSASSPIVELTKTRTR
jgi:dienelactone hydrolase